MHSFDTHTKNDLHIYYLYTQHQHTNKGHHNSDPHPDPYLNRDHIPQVLLDRLF